jgi:hypothetical protein
MTLVPEQIGFETRMVLARWQAALKPGFLLF